MSSDDEARIARWEHLTFSSEERKVQEGVALMRSLLARAVKAEADLAKQTHRENEGVMIFDGIVADLRAKLAAAEKARDAALAAQNARAVEELEALRNWWLGKYNGSIGTVVLVDKIGLRLAALRSSPPAAPAGEAPAQGGVEDVWRTAEGRIAAVSDSYTQAALRAVVDLVLARGER